MAEGRQRDAWNHTASIMALTANVHRDPKQKRTPYESDDFHPLTETKPEPPTVKVSIRALKGLFTGKPADFELLDAAQTNRPTNRPDRPNHGRTR